MIGTGFADRARASGHEQRKTGRTPFGPEVLEDLAKLRRAMKRPAFERLLREVMAGRMVRRQVREIWEQYRRATPEAARKRGRGPELPVEPLDSEQPAEAAYRSAVVSLVVVGAGVSG